MEAFLGVAQDMASTCRSSPLWADARRLFPLGCSGGREAAGVSHLTTAATKHGGFLEVSRVWLGEILQGAGPRIFTSAAGLEPGSFIVTLIFLAHEGLQGTDGGGRKGKALNCAVNADDECSQHSECEQRPEHEATIDLVLRAHDRGMAPGGVACRRRQKIKKPVVASRPGVSPARNQRIFTGSPPKVP